MPLLNLIPSWLYAYGLIIAILVMGVQQMRINSLESNLSMIRLGIEQARAKALQEKTDVESHWRKLLEVSDRIHADEVDQFRTDLSRRTVLRPAVDQFVSKARNSGPSSRSADQQGGDPIGVLAHVLTRESEAADLYARVADERRIIAASCERSYDALTGDGDAVPIQTPNR